MQPLAIPLLLAAVNIAPPVQPDLVDNPGYVSWAQYKPGTNVTLKLSYAVTVAVRKEDGQMIAGAPATGEVTLVAKLLELTANEAVVELRSTAIVDGKEQSVVENRKLAAKAMKENVDQLSTIPLPPGVDTTITGTVTQGKEKIEVKGEQLDAATYARAMEAAQAGVKQTSKAWLVPKVPGAVARMELHLSKDEKKNGAIIGRTDTDITVTATDYTLVKEPAAELDSKDATTSPSGTPVRGRSIGEPINRGTPPQGPGGVLLPPARRPPNP